MRRLAGSWRWSGESTSLKSKKIICSSPSPAIRQPAIGCLVWDCLLILIVPARHELYLNSLCRSFLYWKTYSYTRWRAFGLNICSILFYRVDAVGIVPHFRDALLPLVVTTSTTTVGYNRPIWEESVYVAQENIAWGWPERHLLNILVSVSDRLSKLVAM